MLSHAILQHTDRTRSAEIGLMRVLVATDAWHPQVNGVVRTLTSLARSAQTLGVSIDFLSPDGFRTVPVPTYPGLRLALPSRGQIASASSRPSRMPSTSRRKDRSATWYGPIAEGSGVPSRPATQRDFP